MSFSYRLRCEQMTFLSCGKPPYSNCIYCTELILNLPQTATYIYSPTQDTEKPFLLYIEERFNLLLAYCFCPSLLSFETCSLAQVLAPIHLYLPLQVRLLGFIGPVPPPARDKRVSVPTYTKEMIFICQLIFTFS